ncbi:hypothetical protein LEP1GSC170_0278 [Leptospira interrogans serovar Bataviae str. HAI135]|nr:hypothetical protein LEP1GSC170_0278 [Leptospira interrogans serovar Bataviae str. HAI135]
MSLEWFLEIKNKIIFEYPFYNCKIEPRKGFERTFRFCSEFLT